MIAGTVRRAEYGLIFIAMTCNWCSVFPELILIDRSSASLANPGHYYAFGGNKVMDGYGAFPAGGMS